ncbi:MAG: tRNA (adenosine(37)-N6)-threonylcarbamoyltransferase complex transferase subunit TsaD, partial [Azoarcus sp.]|jgi:N6-L-threonylcarbamoyladenine synthase|nr:tRNA (adenosine(37)-N6)-threonylcarbamoyltransferase complex transferase subunit TsaD [Azoarcus sp.]
LPRPLRHSGDLDFSFSGLKTAVLNVVSAQDWRPEWGADLAADFQQAVVDVLTMKAAAALERTGMRALIVAGGVGANQALRAALDAAVRCFGARTYYPAPALCTDNGVMIAFAAAQRLIRGERPQGGNIIRVRPRWPLSGLACPQASHG